MARNTLKQYAIIFCLLICSTSFAEHEGELGYCALCDTLIFDRVNNYLVKNDEYNEALFEFSNRKTGTVAFCDRHFENLSEKDFPQIIKGIEHGWENEFEINKWSKEQIDKYKKDFFGLKILRGINEKDNCSDCD